MRLFWPTVGSEGRSCETTSYPLMPSRADQKNSWKIILNQTILCCETTQTPASCVKPIYVNDGTCETKLNTRKITPALPAVPRAVAGRVAIQYIALNLTFLPKVLVHEQKMRIIAPPKMVRLWSKESRGWVRCSLMKCAELRARVRRAKMTPVIR